MENKIIPSLSEWTSGKMKGFQGKDLINLQKGTLKLVKVDPFATYPEHIHPNKTEYAYVLQGNPAFEIDAKHYSGEPGDFFIFPSEIFHAIKNKTGNECLLLIGAVMN